MKIATTIKAMPLAVILTVAASFGSSAIAHDITNAGTGVSAVKKQINISKDNAKNLMKEFLRQEYNGKGLQARNIKGNSEEWTVQIKDRLRTVATARIDRKTGNIHVE